MTAHAYLVGEVAFFFYLLSFYLVISRQIFKVIVSY